MRISPVKPWQEEPVHEHWVTHCNFFALSSRQQWRHFSCQLVPAGRRLLPADPRVNLEPTLEALWKSPGYLPHPQPQGCHLPSQGISCRSTPKGKHFPARSETSLWLRSTPLQVFVACKVIAVAVLSVPSWLESVNLLPGYWAFQEGEHCAHLPERIERRWDWQLPGKLPCADLRLPYKLLAVVSELLLQNRSRQSQPTIYKTLVHILYKLMNQEALAMLYTWRLASLAQVSLYLGRSSIVNPCNFVSTSM